MPTKAELQVRVDELEKENASLKKMLSRAERELSGKLLPEELPPADIPDRVSWWMKYFRAPWEAFWCYDHRRWGQFGYRKLLYVKLIFYHFWFFWKRNILDVKTVMRGH
ncbi:TPA: hypothetical protein ACIADH_003093 [Escherichia coli]